jgi:hypothetical protein
MKVIKKEAADGTFGRYDTGKRTRRRRKVTV